MTVMTAVDTLNISAPSWDPYDSYGLIANALAQHLDAHGVRINALQRDGVRMHTTQSEAVRAIVGQPIRPSMGGLLLGYPTEFAQRFPLTRTGPRVAITMFESTQLPPGWVEALNNCDAVIVPSEWLAPVFRANGVTAPVYVVPLGLSEAYQYVERDPEREPFTFLAFADRGARKGWMDAVRCFAELFRDDDSTRLILKTRPSTQLPRFANRNIEVLAEDLSEADMAALYARCDCLVWPSRGEGFGLPPREFAATGGVTIATAWSGMADHLEEWGLGVHYDLVPAWDTHPRFHGLGQWAQPDRMELCGKMHAVRLYREEGLAFGRRAAEAVRRLYRWEDFAAAVLAIWNEVSHAS